MADDATTKPADAPEVHEPPKSDVLGFELGSDQTLPFSTPYQSETEKGENDKLYELLRGGEGFEGPTVRQLVHMRRTDGQARALYRLLTLPIRAALKNSSFVAAEGGDTEQEFIDNVFNLPPEQGGMSVTFHRFMSQLLMGLFDGFSPFEQVFWRPTFGPLSGKYTLQKLAYRPPETVTFITDEQGGFQGLRQRTYLNGKTIDTHIPAYRSFYYAAQEEECKFYGVSFFQSAFYHYDKKAKLYYNAHVAAQRQAVGLRVGTFPLTATVQGKTEFARNLANMSFAQWMIAPEGYKVELLKDSGGYDYLNMINHHNSQMSKSLLASFLDSAQGAGSNDTTLFAAPQPGDSMFLLMLNAIMDDIANSINHYIIPQLIDWNFSGGKYPLFTWGKLTDEQKAAISSTFDKLATVAPTSQGVTPEFMRALEEHMADEMGLDVDYDEVDRRVEEEKAKADAIAAGQPLGPDGQPLPIPAPDAATDPEGAIAHFESQFGGGGAQPPTPPAGATPPGAPTAPVKPPVKRAVKLSADGSEDLLGLAGDLLDMAEVELARVQTPQGQKKYGDPIGAEIVPNAPKQKAREVTIEHLLSLKAALDAAQASGNDDETKSAQGALTEAIQRYAKGRSFKDVNEALKKLSPTPQKA
jgi:hypothetical protein